MKYFTNCKTLEELKKAYRKAALENHPDHGGNVETMAEINAEYDMMFERLKNAHNANTTDETKKTTETPNEFKDIIETLIRLDGIQIEICGSWLWISGNTYTYRKELGAAGCKYSKNKKMWYWHHEEDSYTYRHKSRTTMDEIRMKYGTETVNIKRKAELQGA